MSADVGVGHTSAAKALRSACAAAIPGFESVIVDSYKYSASVFSRVVSSGYLGMVKTIPQMYRFLYDRAERATEVGPFRQWVHQFTAANIRGLMREYAPDAVVCTHAFPCGVMAEYKRAFGDAPPVLGVVTDFAVHAFWVHDNVEKYAVAANEMRDALVARGVLADRIMVSGIPIDPHFGTMCDRQALRDRLGLPPDRKIVLVMGGGLGMAPLQTIMTALESVAEPMCAVAIVGRSKNAEVRVLESAARVHYPVRVLPFVENVHEYMHASDILVTKPGGLTTSEALAASLPMVLFRPLPGQEERNTRYLVRRRAALRAKSAAHLAECVETLLSSDEKRRTMQKAMRALAKPQSAKDIASELERLAAGVPAGEAIA